MRFIELHEEKGVLRYGIWFYLKDYEPRLQSDTMGRSERADQIHTELAQCAPDDSAQSATAPMARTIALFKTQAAL